MTSCETILFVDCWIRRRRLMVEGLDPHARAYRLSPGGDLLTEIASVVSRAAPVGRIAVLTRRTPGTSSLAGQQTGRSKRETKAETFARIRAALAPGADILLMLCGDGTYRPTQVFIAELEAGLGVPVHATETDLSTEAGRSSVSAVATIFAPSALASYSERFAVCAASCGGDGADSRVFGFSTGDDRAADPTPGNDRRALGSAKPGLPAMPGIAASPAQASASARRIAPPQATWAVAHDTSGQQPSTS